MRETKLTRFLAKHRGRVLRAEVARRSGYSRMHLNNVEKGRSEPTREFMDVITVVCTELSGEVVTRDDLFERKPYRGRKASTQRGRKAS